MASAAIRPQISADKDVIVSEARTDIASSPVAVDAEEIVAGLTPAVARLAPALALGRELAGRIDRVYFVACGSPNRAMLGLQYWIEHLSRSLEVRRYFPAEFMAQNPARLDGRTLVVLGSKSGTTPETVAAAEFLRTTPAITVGLTQLDSSPLARTVQHCFAIGETPESFIGMAMAAQSLIGGLVEGRDGFEHAEVLRSSLAALPRVFADTAVAMSARGAETACALRADRNIYLVASGPCFSNAYVFGVCILMEMLWLHSYPVEAAEFFHGPFEIIERQTPLVLILGEDPSRPLMERVLRFCEKQSDRLFIFDSKELAMPGIAPEVRAMLAPYVLQAALKRISENLSALHSKPLSTRRYMWKMDY
jgi:fructoselysine 6-phosphate deglycase